MTHFKNLLFLVCRDIDSARSKPLASILPQNLRPITAYHRRLTKSPNLPPISGYLTA